jgi:hypothetical protein
MTEINEVVSCDGTCGLSPADCANLHPDPMTALKAQMVETVQRRLGSHPEPFPHAAEFLVDGVLADLEAHPSLTIRHYAPTQDAYDAACAALEKHRTRADEAEAEWLTTDQVVARYQLNSKDTLYLLRSRGRGPKGYRFGKELRFKVSDLRDWEEQNSDEARERGQS